MYKISKIEGCPRYGTRTSLFVLMKFNVSHYQLFEPFPILNEVRVGVVQRLKRALSGLNGLPGTRVNYRTGYSLTESRRQK